VLDATRCISYLTIEVKGAIPEDRRAGVGRHVFGCDICQDVCPWNRRRRHAGREAFAAREGLVAPDLLALAGSSLDEDAFRARFRGSPVKRAKRRGLLRNVAVALGNAGDAGGRPVLEIELGENPLDERPPAAGGDSLGDVVLFERGEQIEQAGHRCQPLAENLGEDFVGLARRPGFTPPRASSLSKAPRSLAAC
jgi:epoxyqueuosine reductase